MRNNNNINKAKEEKQKTPPKQINKQTKIKKKDKKQNKTKQNKKSPPDWDVCN